MIPEYLYFVSGHLDLTEQEFLQHYKELLDDAVQRNGGFVVGDTRRGDRLAQSYLQFKTLHVTVYHTHERSKYCRYGFKTIGNFENQEQCDIGMTLHSHADIAWVRPGCEDSDIQQNIDRRKQYFIRKWWITQPIKYDYLQVLHLLGWNANTIQIQSEGLVSINGGKTFHIEHTRTLYEGIQHHMASKDMVWYGSEPESIDMHQHLDLDTYQSFGIRRSLGCDDLLHIPQLLAIELIRNGKQTLICSECQAIYQKWYAGPIMNTLCPKCNERHWKEFEHDHIDDIQRINDLQHQGHTHHCACRQVWGDGECECAFYGMGYDPYRWLAQQTP